MNLNKNGHIYSIVNIASLKIVNMNVLDISIQIQIHVKYGKVKSIVTILCESSKQYRKSHAIWDHSVTCEPAAVTFSWH